MQLQLRRRRRMSEKDVDVRTEFYRLTWSANIIISSYYRREQTLCARNGQDGRRRMTYTVVDTRYQ